MYAPVWTSLLNAASVWGPWLSACGLILFAAQRAWVAYLKHRGAEYVLAQADLLRAQNEPELKKLDITAQLLLPEPRHATISPDSVSAETHPADDAKPLPLKSAKRAVASSEDLHKAA